MTITTIAEWDTTLALLLNGTQIAFNDDDNSLPNRFNSRIVVTLPENGVYEIEVRSYANRDGGTYTLVIESQGAAVASPAVTPSPIPTEDSS